MAEQAPSSSGSSSSSSGGFGGLGSIIGAASTIATTIAGISDMNKRRVIEENLNLMTATQRAALEKQIAATNNKNDRATILINSVLAARDANANRAQRTQTVKWVLIGVFGLGTLITIAWFIKKK